MMIDSHQHFWSPVRGDYFWMAGDAVAPIRRPILPADFAEIRATHGIDKTVLVQAAATTHETEYMLGLADATRFVAKVVGWIDFERPQDLEHLARFSAHPKFSGVRPMIQDIADADWMHRPDVQWAYKAVIDLDLTFDALGYPIHADNFLKLFQRYPEMRVVVDHCLKPVIRDQAFAPWARDMTRIARETTAFCKLSGLATEARPGWTSETLRPYAEHIIDVFGPARVMWGSDWPVLELNGTYTSWREAALSYVADEQERNAIFGGTAARFYRIQE
jgi:L-fuconolactonase